MDNNNSLKIRNLIDTDNVHTCWKDVILSTVAVSAPLLDLEFNSRKADLKKAKAGIRELKVKIKEFEQRLNGEISEDVFYQAGINNRNYKGNAESLIKYRANS